MTTDGSTESPASSSRFRLRLKIRQLVNLGCFAILALVILGSIIRWTIRDAVMPSGVIFYATPPAMMVLLMLGVVVVLERKFVSTRRLAMLLLVGAVGWTVQSQWISNPPNSTAQPTASVKVMFWNVCEGKYSWDNVIATIQLHNPDIIALAEADRLKDQDAEFFEKQFPGYQRLDFPRRLLLLSRLPIRRNRRLAWVRGCVVEAAELETESGRMTLVMSDVASTVFSHRKPQIEALTDAVSHISGPAIIVGDLNTPVESPFFETLRQTYVNAFESRGHGLYTTWPMPLPVMAIDHMWGSRGIEFQQVQILWTTASDHRPLVAEFTVQPSQ